MRVLAANFTQSSTFSEASSDKDMLDNVRSDWNTIGAAPVGRFGIVNTAVYTALEADARIASGDDYHGQQRKANAYGHLQNVAGFEKHP